MEHVRAAWRRFLASPARDATVALLVTVVLVAGSYGEGHPRNPADKAQFHGPVPHPTVGALALVVVAGLVLAWRRRWPLAVLAVSLAATVCYSLLGYVNGAVLLAPVLALYAVATQLSARRAAAVAAVTVAVLMTATAIQSPFGDVTGGGFDLIPFLGAAALSAGLAVANRRAYAASIQERALQEARRRVDEERLRIARELHDVVAHTMATINVQAGTAAHVLGTHPPAVAESLQAIKTASKEGLRELRAILNVLRQADEADPTQPAPGLGQLEALIAGARRSGLQTALEVTGEPRTLPAAVDLAAYRIIQESLTNTIRHAGPATASVSLGYLGDELRIDVADTGRGLPPGTMAGGPGHGLAGMRERAASVGGTVQAGPAPEGGYRVAARLPLRGRLTERAAAPPAPRAGGGSAKAAARDGGTA